MPPIKIYETLQQSNQEVGAMDKGGANRGDEFDFFKKDDEQKIDVQSALNGGGSVDNRASPQKSLAIKGPPKIISEKLEIASY